MTADDRSIVRVRVNASGKRLIGYVDLSADESSRFSDVLNNSDAYIQIREQPYASTPGQVEAQAVFKDSISYIEVLEEPTSQKRLLPGIFHTVTAEFKEPAVALCPRVTALLSMSRKPAQ